MVRYDNINVVKIDLNQFLEIKALADLNKTVIYV